MHRGLSIVTGQGLSTSEPFCHLGGGGGLESLAEVGSNTRCLMCLGRGGPWDTDSQWGRVGSLCGLGLRAQDSGMQSWKVNPDGALGHVPWWEPLAPGMCVDRRGGMKKGTSAHDGSDGWTTGSTGRGADDTGARRSSAGSSSACDLSPLCLSPLTCHTK